MESVTFDIPDLNHSEVVDLSNTLTALNGVGSVSIDAGASTVQISFDPSYSNPAIIRSNIVGAGYPVDGEGRAG